MTMTRSGLRSVAVCVVVPVLLAGCRREPVVNTAPAYGEKATAAGQTVEYVFAVNPLHSPVRLFSIYQPMVDIVNQQAADFRLKLETSESFAAFEAKLAKRTVHFALANPYQTLTAEKTGYRVFAKRGDDEKVRGIVLVRKDSGIKEISDLKGATISFPAPTALFGSMMPKYFLKKQGLDVDRDAHPVYVGTQDSAILNVYQGQAKAGCSWLGLWEQLVAEKPELAETLVVKWLTEPLINNSLMARDDIPEPHVRKVRDSILSLQTTEAGRAVLKKMNLTRYDPATSETYEPVRAFMRQYEAEFATGSAGKEQP